MLELIFEEVVLVTVFFLGVLAASVEFIDFVALDFSGFCLTTACFAIVTATFATLLLAGVFFGSFFEESSTDFEDLVAIGLVDERPVGATLGSLFRVRRSDFYRVAFFFWGGGDAASI